MRPHAALLVALLCLSAAVAPVAGIAATAEQTESIGPLRSVTTVENTTNQLSVPSSEIRKRTYRGADVDIGTAGAAWSAQVDQRHDTLTFEERFQSESSNEARTRLIRDRLTAIRADQQDLDRRQSDAIRRYADGEITAAAFLKTRLRVNAEAATLLTSLDRISAAQNRASGFTLNDRETTRLRTIEGELRTLTGPVGTRLISAGDGPARDQIYLEASSDGYVLATVADDRYVREARLGSARDASLPDEFRNTAVSDGDPETNRLRIADERADDIYPWLYERQSPSLTFYGTSGIYELTADHPNGDLTAYLDAGTTDVFYETQYRDLSRVRTRATEQRVNGTLSVTVRQSSETGPMVVSASNNETGAAVDGRVTINGRPVGSTGSDGRIWTVEPSGSYSVTVATDTGRTTVSVVDP